MEGRKKQTVATMERGEKSMVIPMVTKEKPTMVIRKKTMVNPSGVGSSHAEKCGRLHRETPSITPTAINKLFLTLS